MWQESSVEVFGSVHAKVQDGDEEQSTTRGVSLRQLQSFFEEHDKGKGYAGLRRVGADDGTAIWTQLDDDKIKKALEDRAKEWRSEESRLLRDAGNGAKEPNVAETRTARVEPVATHPSSSVVEPQTTAPALEALHTKLAQMQSTLQALRDEGSAKSGVCSIA